MINISPTIEHIDINSIYAVDLYFWNKSISQDLFFIISIFEIIFRNHIDNALIEINGDEYFDYLSKYLKEKGFCRKLTIT